MLNDITPRSPRPVALIWSPLFLLFPFFSVLESQSFLYILSVYFILVHFTLVFIIKINPCFPHTGLLSLIIPVLTGMYYAYPYKQPFYLAIFIIFLTGVCFTKRIFRYQGIDNLLWKIFTSFIAAFFLLYFVYPRFQGGTQFYGGLYTPNTCALIIVIILIFYIYSLLKHISLFYCCRQA